MAVQQGTMPQPALMGRLCFVGEVLGYKASQVAHRLGARLGLLSASHKRSCPSNVPIQHHSSATNPHSPRFDATMHPSFGKVRPHSSQNTAGKSLPFVFSLPRPQQLGVVLLHHHVSSLGGTGDNEVTPKAQLPSCLPGPALLTAVSFTQIHLQSESQLSLNQRSAQTLW